MTKSFNLYNASLMKPHALNLLKMIVSVHDDVFFVFVRLWTTFYDDRVCDNYSDLTDTLY